MTTLRVRLGGGPRQPRGGRSITWAKIALVVLLLPGAYAQEERGSASPTTLESVFDEAIQALQAAAGPAERDTARAKFFNARRALADVETVRAEALAAAKRIRVHPAADTAGNHIAHLRYRPALDELATALRADADDPYAGYLAGLCRFELGEFSAAAAAFERVLRREPESRVAAFLADLCRCAADRGRPDDESIAACFDAALRRAEAPLAHPAGASFEESFARAFDFPPLLRDPLLFKLDAEALEDRGPGALPIDRLAEIARKAHEPLLLYGVHGVLIAELADSAAPELPGLTEAHHRERAAFDFFFADPDRDGYRDPSPAHLKRLEQLAANDPDEGLWRLFRIRFRAEEGDDLRCPPLTPDEIEHLERAAAAPRLTYFPAARKAADLRVLAAAGVFLPERFADGPSYGLVHLRNIAKRAASAVRAAAGRGDRAEARRLHQALETVIRRLDFRGRGDLLGVLLDSAYRRIAIEAALDALPLSDEERLARYALLRDTYVSDELVRHSVPTIALQLPVPRIRALFGPPLTEPARAWQRIRAERVYAESGAGEVVVRVLGHAVERETQPFAKHVFAAGCWRIPEALPLLRSVAGLQLDDDRRYALIWALGEHRDPADSTWLKREMNNPRRWLALAAEESLTRLPRE